MKPIARAFRASAIAALAAATPIVARAVASSFSAASAAGCIDTRDAAVDSGAAAPVVVDARACAVAGSPDGTIDVSNDLAFVLILR